MMLKKREFQIVLIVLAACVLFICFNQAILSNNKSNKSERKNYKENTQPTLFNLAKFRDDHNNIYGGSYIDQKGYINLMLIEGTKVKDIPELSNDRVIVHYVKYTYKELENILNLFNPRIQELGIFSIGINDEKNNVEILIQDMTDEKINKIKKVYDSPAIEFNNLDSGGTLQF